MIALHEVCKDYARTVVLDRLDLTVDAGTVLALLGPNGAGKTTVVHILTTLVRPDAGTATVAGFDVVEQADQVKHHISLTGQSAAVDELLTGEENLRMMGRLFGLGRAAGRARASELLERFDLTDAARRLARSYSGGMRRRLDLAISLLAPRPVVFLDEPTTGLDTRSRQQLWALIRDLAADGTTVLLTTQYLEEADQLADRIAVLDHGRLVAEGTSAQLKARVGGEVVTVTGPAGELLQELPTDGTPARLRRALDQIDRDGTTGRIGIRAPSLDDVFLALTTDRGDTPSTLTTSSKAPR